MKSGAPDLLPLAARAIAWALLIALLLQAVPVAAEFAEPTHWEFELTVNAPATVGEPFQANFTATLVGSRPGIWLQPPMSLTYAWRVTGPDGQEPPLADKLPRWTTQQAQLTGTVLHDGYSFTPDQNGTWSFRVWQLEGRKQTLAIERDVTTDKAFVSPAVLPGATPAVQLVSGIRLDPAQPVVGQPVTIGVQMGNDPLAQAFGELAVNLIDDEGVQPLGVVNPSGGSASLLWIPQHPTDHGQLQVGDQLAPVLVLDAPPNPAPVNDADTAPAPDEQGAE